MKPCNKRISSHFIVRALRCVTLSCVLLSTVWVSGCVEFLRGSTFFLDFQHSSEEMKKLLSEDRIGMTKAGLLAEIAKTEYAYFERWGRQKGWEIPQDFFCVSVMFPSNIPERTLAAIQQAKVGSGDRGCAIDLHQIASHTHESSVDCSEQGLHLSSWQESDSGLEIRVSAKEWGLVTESDFENFLGRQIDLDTFVSAQNADSNRDWVSFCLRESCCWAIYLRYHDGNTYQAFGSLKYDMVIIEFDFSGRVVRQYKMSNESLRL